MDMLLILRVGENLAVCSAGGDRYNSIYLSQTATYRMSQLNVRPFQTLTTQNNAPVLAEGTLNISASKETQMGR